MKEHLKDLISTLASDAREVLDQAALLASQRGHFEITSEHFAFVLIQRQPKLLEGLVLNSGLRSASLYNELARRIEDKPCGNEHGIVFSESFVTMLEAARTHGQGGPVSATCFWASWLRAADEAGAEIASLQPWLTCDRDAADTWLQAHGKVLEPYRPEQPGAGALQAYAHNLTQQARERKLDPVTGRENEIREIIDVLLRRRQNNPLLVGEPGVGKTALVEGVAQRIVAGEVPEALKHCELYSVDLGLLVAGASVKGEFEKRLQALLAEATASPTPVVLFIDEAHRLQGAGGAAGQNDAANLLKPALSRGELQVIAATTWAEFKMYFEKDAALTRRFQAIKVAAPDQATAVTILRNAAPLLEKHHGVTILHEAIEAAVTLSERYIVDRQLPDKSLTLLDTACAHVSLSQCYKPRSVERMDAELQRLAQHSDWLQRPRENTEALETLANREKQLKQERQRLEARWSRQKGLVQDLGTHTHMRPDTLTALMQEHEQEALVYAHVDAACVADVLSGWTGIPLGRLRDKSIASEHDILSRLKSRIAGQETALRALAQKLFIAHAGLQAPNKPAGVFMLAGPSGVGKTETALALADLYGTGTDSLITVNMSEYQESHSVSALKGAPAGYVGYGKGGVLTEAVRKNPYSVVLLDEIEKAHPDVIETLYQVLDKGWMEDSEGQHINFQNTLIVMTSNVGCQTIQQHFDRHDISTETLLKALQDEFDQTFKPAFMGRMELLPYLPLSEEQLLEIARKKLNIIADRVKEASQNKLELFAGPSVIKAAINDPSVRAYGARALDKLLDRQLMPKLAALIANNPPVQGAIRIEHCKAGFRCRPQKS